MKSRGKLIMRDDRASLLLCSGLQLRIMLPAVLFLLAGCTGIPEGVTTVRGIRLERYPGIWYVIARLDHSFERGLVDVSAT
jgi:apolipoprotein D and lipocalin family protein